MRNLFIILMGLALLGSGWAQSWPILHPVRPGKHFGYVDEKGVLVVPAELDKDSPLVQVEESDLDWASLQFESARCKE